MTISPGNASKCSVRVDDLVKRSGRWDPHADMCAIVPQQGKGDRGDAGVIDVPDGGPRVPGHPRVGDVIRDTPQARDSGPAVMAGNDVQQLPACLELGQLGCG